MAEQFIQQPDGKWAIYSTVCDSLTGVDFTEDEIVQYAVNQAKERVERDTRDYMNKRRDGGKLTQFSVSWEEAKQNTLKRYAASGDPEFIETVKNIKGRS